MIPGLSVLEKAARSGRPRFPAPEEGHAWGSCTSRPLSRRPSGTSLVGEDPAARLGGTAPCISKPATCHTFRHSLATHLLKDCSRIHTVQELLGIKDVATTMVYPHVLDCVPAGVKSGMDRMLEEARGWLTPVGKPTFLGCRDLLPILGQTTFE